MEVGFYGSEGDFQGLGDFFECEIVDEAQQDDFLLDGFEGFEDLGQFVFDGVGVGRNRRGLGFWQFVGNKELSGFFLLPQGDVFDDRVEEGAQIGCKGEAGEFLQEPGERFLCDVEGFVAVSGVAAGQLMDPVAVPEIKPLISGHIATIGGRNVGLIGVHGR